MAALAAASVVETSSMEIVEEELSVAGDDPGTDNNVDVSPAAKEGTNASDAGQASDLPSSGERRPHANRS